MVKDGKVIMLCLRTVIYHILDACMQQQSLYRYGKFGFYRYLLNFCQNLLITDHQFDIDLTLI